MIENLISVEWINADDTKNKSVTITAVASEDPYTCVSSQVIGDGHFIVEQSASIILTAIPSPSTAVPHTGNVTSTTVSKKAGSHTLSTFGFRGVCSCTETLT